MIKRYWLLVLFLTVACWGLAATVEPWFQGWSGNRADSGNLLQIALGDGRKLFSRHAYAKADAYFHNGYYPSIFDNEKGFENAHIDEVVGVSEESESAKDFLGEPRDWIDKFGRNFYPSEHAHLGDEDCGRDHDHEGLGDDDHDHGHDHEEGEGSDPEHSEKQQPAKAQREILPWLLLSVEMDPNRVETYAVGAYLLRNKLGKPEEAERFLRRGLRANPLAPLLLFELGRIAREERHDTDRARNVWEVALRRLDSQEVDPDNNGVFLRAQILGQLAKMEEDLGHPSRAVEHLRMLEAISPNAESIRRWIEDLRAAADSSP